MDINQWLDKQIDEGRWHPDFKQIYKTITKGYQEYLDKFKVDTFEVKAKEFPCPECQAKRTYHKKTCSMFRGNPRVKIQ